MSASAVYTIKGKSEKIMEPEGKEEAQIFEQEQTQNVVQEKTELIEQEKAPLVEDKEMVEEEKDHESVELEEGEMPSEDGNSVQDEIHGESGKEKRAENAKKCELFFCISYALNLINVWCSLK